MLEIKVGSPEWRHKIKVVDLKIREHLSKEAKLRGVEFKLEIDTESERFMTFSNLETLENLLEVLENPGEMRETLRKHFDGYFGVKFEESIIELADENRKSEYKMAA